MWLSIVPSLSFLDLSQTLIHPNSLETGSVIWQVMGLSLVRPEQSELQKNDVINGSYRELVELGSWLCFPTITLTGRKMGLGGGRLEFLRGRHSFSLACRLIKRRRHGEGLPDTVWICMRSDNQLYFFYLIMHMHAFSSSGSTPHPDISRVLCYFKWKLDAIHVTCADLSGPALTLFAVNIFVSTGWFMKH